jgi:hypothetical protein
VKLFHNAESDPLKPAHNHVIAHLEIHVRFHLRMLSSSVPLNVAGPLNVRDLFVSLLPEKATSRRSISQQVEGEAATSNSLARAV